ncbi:MAG TPA: DUF4012 domain-containing protein [Anaerolineales bacterium]|nr:DUF4012 domain-containing protein [Anaerolineales bacterium]
MPPETSHLETLKYILENSLHPEVLDSHPWTNNLVVIDAVTHNPELEDKSPGQKIILTVAKLFIQMMPSTPPKHGKRLDTRWGEFGILASQYFAPLQFGTPSPDSLRDAWGRIDQSILIFVFGKPEDTLSDTEKETYKLIGDETEVAPNSTISDWHRKGLQHLSDLIQARENFLSTSSLQPEAISQTGQAGVLADDLSSSSNTVDQNIKIQSSHRRRFIIPVLILIVLSLLLIGGLKAWKIYDLAMLVYQDAMHIQELIAKPASRLEKVRTVGPALGELRQDFTMLKNESEPFFWMGPWLKWVPVYGGELASIQDLVTIADSLLVTADVSYLAVLPILNEKDHAGVDLPGLTEELLQARTKFIKAQGALELATTARSRLNLETLSPEVRNMIVNKVDPLLSLMQEVLPLAVEFPRMLGATEEGPKTYLLLVQNEDELRPTGGFITAAGTLLVTDGRISNLNFRSSEYFDDWSKPYPVAPWQLSQYMNSRVLIFRDANWFTNYPTAALYAEYLYSYTSDHSVDGVIAFDQQMLVEVLGVTGPIDLEDVDHPIDAGNVVSYMRSSKTPTPEEAVSPEWNNKAFINKITRALMEKIFNGDVDSEELATVFLQALNEHHILFQVDNPFMTSVLEKHHWDGAVRPDGTDFLMVVDSNIGFNKTNAVVESSLVYDVDLTKPKSPTASLMVFHKNNAPEIVFCKHWNKVRAVGERDYPITDCYWNYLRVYMKEGTKLLDADPQSVPDNWMILKQENPGQVDILEEEIDGVQAFGTLQVLLGGESLSANFDFALPADILSFEPGSDRRVYHLKVQKQPGTAGVPITIRVHLPKNAFIERTLAGADIQDNNILFQTDLITDIEFEVVFTLP